MSIKRAIYDVASFKALPTEGEEHGQFEALVSVFGNVDRQGDRVVEGAFDKTIQEWRTAGTPLPIVWSHQWANPHAHIGFANPSEVEEVPGKGLKVAGAIDLDNPFAAQVYRLLKERRVKEFSFGYEVKKEKRQKDGANDLLELGLIEVGPTLKGANPSTELLAVKSQLEEATPRGVKSPPWHVEDDNADCDGYAVVVDETGEVVGCHDTRAAAERHMAALYENVEEAADDEKTPAVFTSYTTSATVPVELIKYVDDRLSELVGEKAGRTISRKNEGRLRAARDSIDEVLASLGDATDTSDEDEAEATGKAPTETEGKANDSRHASLRTQLNLIGD